MTSRRVRSGRAFRRFFGFLLLCVGLLCPGGAAANDTVWEFWPEIDVWVKLPHDVRLSSFIALSRREVTDYREGTFILQADHAWKTSRFPGLRRRLVDEAVAAEMKPILFRGGILSGTSLNDDGQEYSERSALLELHVRTPLKGELLLSNRLRSDLRFLGEDHDFSWRVRYRVMLEKEFKPHGTSIVPYGSVEPYYDSRYSKFNRTRLIGGASVGLGKHGALEGNLTYQFDSESEPSHLAALNLILHLYF